MILKSIVTRPTKVLKFILIHALRAGFFAEIFRV